MELRNKIEKQVNFKQFPVYDVISQINHVNLKKINIRHIGDYHVGIEEEYIEGQTLKTVIQEQHCNKLVINNYIFQLISALEALHLNNIIHRDIKPENIIIGNDNILRLIDYDIARIYKEDKETDTTLFGTRGYAPPEQFGFTQSDFRSDIYALGVVLNELDIAYDLKLKAIVEMCCEIDPKKRYQSTSHLRIDFLNTIEKNVAAKLSENFIENEQEINHQKQETSRYSNIKMYIKEIKNDFSVLRGFELFLYIMSTFAVFDINLETYNEVNAPVIYFRVLIILFICFILIVMKLFDKYRWNRIYVRWGLWMCAYLTMTLFFEWILEIGRY